MSQFSGKQYKGAMRDRRVQRRTEAEVRNGQTPDARRRVTREGPASQRRARSGASQ